MNTKDLKKRIKKWHRLDAVMLAVMVLLALLVPVAVVKGEWLNALLSCMWVFIGVKYYQSREQVTETIADSLELMETYDKLIDHLKRTIIDIAVAKGEEEHNEENPE